jgi:hypothetical protein
MVTNYPHQMASREELADSGVANRGDDGFGAGVLDRVRQMFCGIHGHDTMLQFERDRMFLRCVSCGHRSPGWELTETPPTVKVRGDARRHMLRPQLVGARRIA